jgi:hypothetical protein
MQPVGGPATAVAAQATNQPSHRLQTSNGVCGVVFAQEWFVLTVLRACLLV